MKAVNKTILIIMLVFCVIFLINRITFAGIEEMLMPEAKVIVKGKLPDDCSVNIDLILNDPELNASRIDDFVVWQEIPDDCERSSCCCYHESYPESVKLLCALSQNGTFLFGAEGPVPEVLSAICPGQTSFEIHLKPRTINLTDSARSKLLLLDKKGYISGLQSELPMVDFANYIKKGLSFEIKHRLENKITDIFYGVFSLRGNEDIWRENGYGVYTKQHDIWRPGNTLWCPFTSAFDNGTAIRSCKVNYEGEIASFVNCRIFNNNKIYSLLPCIEAGWVKLDGIEVVNGSGRCCSHDRKLYNQYPQNIELGIKKCWSHTLSYVGIAFIGDSITFSDWNETPSLGHRKNPPPEILVLEPNIWYGDYIEYSPDDPMVGKAVTFDILSSFDPSKVASYEWDFGDGITGTGATVNHIYQEPGDYNISLLMTTTDGEMAASSVTITVKDFQLRKIHSINATAVGFEIGDVDNDNLEELVITDTSNNQILVYDAQYNFEYSLPFNETPRAVIISDINNDGKNELIVGTATGSSADGPGYAYIGEVESTGNFVEEWKSPPYCLKWADDLTVGDLNSNGRKELIMGLAGNDDKLVSYEYTGSTYTLIFTEDIGSDVDSVSVAEDKLFVGTSCSLDYGMRIYNKYNIEFSDLNNGSTCVSAGDVNGDGKIDIVRAMGGKCECYSSGLVGKHSYPRPSFSIYDETYTDVFTSPELSVDSVPRHVFVTTGDLLTGGGEEIVVGIRSETHEIIDKIRLYRYNGTTYEEVWNEDLSDVTDDVYHLRIADLDGDGKNEFFVSTTYGLKVFAPSCCSLNTFYQDSDADGFGNPDITTLGYVQPAGYSFNNLDCNDTDPDIHPTAVEYVDGKDNDCDGEVDEPNDLTNGLVAYYPFNGNAYDESGNGKHGIVYGSTLCEDRFGNANSAFNFDGVDDYVIVQKNSSLIPGNSLTLSAWFKTNSGNQQPILEWNDGNHCGVHMWINVPCWPGTGANLADTINISSWNIISYSSDFLLNEWHQLVVTYNGITGDACVYLDGVLHKTKNLGSFIPQTSYNLYIGKRPGREQFKGLIDDIYIYNRALSESEIRRIYLSEVDSLVGYWKFDDPNDLGLDSSGYGNHGKVTYSDVSYEVEGIINGAARFIEGISDSAIEIPYSDSLRLTSGSTMAAWINLDGCDTDNGDNIISKGSSEPYSFFARLENSTPGVMAGNFGPPIYTDYVPPAGLWVHMVVTFDNGISNFYVNSNPISFKTGGYILDNNASLYIGASPYGAVEDFSGLMDEVRIYNRALSETEIQALYCDGLNLKTYYRDADSDGYGDLNNTLESCFQPNGYVLDDTDCLDTDPNIYPTAIEYTDNKDNDCDGMIDEIYVDAYKNSTANQWLDTGIDLSIGTELNITAAGTACHGDINYYCFGPNGNDSLGILFGFGSLVGKIGNGDIFFIGTSYHEVLDSSGRLYLGYYDSDYSNNTGGFEVAVNISCVYYYKDHDKDGFGISEDFRCLDAPDEAGEYTALVYGDCNDKDPAINPGMTEICNGVDDDCDSLIDEELTRPCSTACGTGTETCQDGQWTACDASQPEPEVCDGKDNDCNGVVDDPDVLTYKIYYKDADGDSYGDQNNTRFACKPPDKYVLNGDDCNDQDPLIHSGATENCYDELDNDCDGLIDSDDEDCNIEECTFRASITATGQALQGACYKSSVFIGIGPNAETYSSPGPAPNYTVYLTISEGLAEDIRGAGSDFERWDLILEIGDYADPDQDGYYPVLSWDTNQFCPPSANSHLILYSVNDQDKLTRLTDMHTTNFYQTKEEEGEHYLDWCFLKYAVIRSSGCIVENDLAGGWNIISLPVLLQSNLASEIFPDAAVIYRFEKGFGYVRVKPDEALVHGTGYWILLPEAKSYSLLGECIMEYSLPVENGWYLIGSCSGPSKASINCGSIDVIYRFKPGFGYQRVLESEMLMPGSGYWILISNIPDQCQAVLKVQGVEPPAGYIDESHIDNAKAKRRMKSLESQDGQWRLGITVTGQEYQGAGNISSIYIGMDNNSATYPSPGYLPNYTVDMKVSGGFLEDIREKGSGHEVWNLIVEIGPDADYNEEDYYPVLSWNPADIGTCAMKIRRGDTETGEVLVDDMLTKSTYQTQAEDGYYDPDSGRTFLFYTVVLETTGSETDPDNEINPHTNANGYNYGSLNQLYNGYMYYWFGAYSDFRLLIPSFYNAPYAHFNANYDNYYTGILGWQPFLYITEDQNNYLRQIWMISWGQPFALYF
ncbi:MAG: LamG-like jellyroll fold domain-containing protein [bacterium]